MDFTSLPVFREPLCIIESDHEGTLCIKDEVLDQIALLDKKLHIVTIVGLYRTGKSYLLNRLAGANKGFPLGSTIKAQTKGIWAWCHPHPVYTDHILILLDSEGLGDVEKGNSNHDYWILALAVLLSSTLVYNIIGTFSEYDLEKLSFVTEISNYIRISAKGEGDTNYDQFFPMFILSLRDFSLSMVNEDREVTPDEYLEDFCLNVQEEKTDKERRYNKTRTSIRKYFKTRKCFTFDRPGSRTVLQALKEMDYVELSKDFIEDCDKFIKYIHEECPVKRVDNGRAVNGSMLVTLVRSYVEAIRNGSVPCVEDALATMAEIENRKLLESCCEIYTREMGVILKLPTPDEQTLLDAHQHCMKKAADYFLEKYIYDKDTKFQMEASAKVLEVYEKYKRDNEVASVECCEKALQDLNAKMLEKLQKENYCRPGGYVEYMSDLNELQEKYMRLEGLGCKKEETLLKFLDRKNSERQTIEQADIKMTEKEEEVKKERKRADVEAREKVEIERHAEKSRVEFEEKIREKDENFKQLEENIVAEIKKIKEETDKVVDERVAKEKSKNEDKLLKELEKLNKQTRYLQESLERHEREQQQMENRITRLNAERNRYLQERQSMSRPREENSSRCSLS